MLTGWLLMATLGGSPQVAILVLGDGAGLLQEAIEQQLQVAAGMRLLGAAAVASSLGMPQVPATDDAKRKQQIDTLIAQSQKSYYHDALDEADESLGLAWSILERMPHADGAQAAGLLLWRAAVALARRQADAAQRFVQQALNRDPDLLVDISELRPSLRILVDRLRSEAGSPLSVEVQPFPENAQVVVDGRLVGTRFRVLAGTHHLRLSAAGFRTAEVPFTSEHRALHIALAIDPVAEIQRLAQNALAAETARVDMKWLADRLAVDCVSLLSANGNQGRGIIQCNGLAATPLQGDAKAIAAAIVAALHPPEVAPTAAAPAPLPPTAELVEPAPTDRTTTWRFLAAVEPMFYGSWIAGNKNLRGLFVGPAAGGEGSLHTRRLALSAAAHHAELLAPTVTVRANTAEGVERSITGGRRTEVSGSGGYRFGGDSVDGEMGLALGWARQRTDRSDPNFAEFRGLFRGYDRLWLGLAGAATTAVGNAALDISVVLTPVAWVQERPRYVSGEDVLLSVGSRLRAQLRYGDVWPWGVRLDLNAQLEEFAGAATIPVEPSLNDVRRVELVGSVQVWGGWQR